MPGLIATIQATETIKILTGLGRTLVGRLLLYDALAMEWTEFALKKDPACPACGDNPTVTELIDYQGFCGSSRGLRIESRLRVCPRLRWRNRWRAVKNCFFWMFVTRRR